MLSLFGPAANNRGASIDYLAFNFSATLRLILGVQCFSCLDHCGSALSSNLYIDSEPLCGLSLQSNTPATSNAHDKIRDRLTDARIVNRDTPGQTPLGWSWRNASKRTHSDQSNGD